MNKEGIYGPVIRHVLRLSDNWDVGEVGCLTSGPKIQFKVQLSDTYIDVVGQMTCLTSGMSDNCADPDLTGCQPDVEIHVLLRLSFCISFILLIFLST